MPYYFNVHNLLSRDLALILKRLYTFSSFYNIANNTYCHVLPGSILDRWIISSGSWTMLYFRIQILKYVHYSHCSITPSYEDFDAWI